MPVPVVEADSSLTRAQAGDAAAFEPIVREYEAMVFSLAYRFLGDAAAAEDLAQDVFLELFRRLSRIESPAHLTFWLRRVTTHRCIDRFRRRNAREQTLAALPHRVHAVYAEQVGTPEERLVTDLHTLRGQRLSYFSLVILRQDKSTLVAAQQKEDV